MSIISYLREYFFPFGCAGCGEALLNPRDAWFGLCSDCKAYLATALASENNCRFCGKPLISEQESCIPCRDAGGGHLVGLKSVFPYTGKFRSVLAAYKFGKSLAVGNYLAECLVAASLAITAGFDSSALKETAFVPVPPRPGKIKTQGWDQVDYLAGILNSEYRHSLCAIPVSRCLKRLPSQSQKALNREDRGNNLKGRILCVRPPPKTAIIFDDVITTGATVNACAEALLKKGASKVYAVCLFYD